MKRFTIRLATLALLAFAGAAQAAVIGPSLEERLATARPADVLQVVVTFHGKDAPTAAQLAAVNRVGVRGYYFTALPIAGVLATPQQVRALAQLREVRSVYHNDRLEYDNDGGTSITGVKQLRADALLKAANGGLPFTGKGVTVLVNDSGVDGTHPDLAYPSHVIQNTYAGTNLAALQGDVTSLGGPAGLLPVTYVEGVPNTDFGGSHGSHVAGIVGGSGAASGGLYTGVAPGASLIGYGSGAVIFVLDGLGGFNYAKVQALTHPEYNLRVITNSYGSPGQIGQPFDPEDPTNVASKILSDMGMIVVFSAGNSGGNAGAEGSITGVFKKAPWVLVAANGIKDGRIANSSSRGESNYSKQVTVTDPQTGAPETFTVYDRPTVIAPGTNIVSTRAVAADPFIPLDLTVDAEFIAPEHLPYYSVKSGTSMAAPHLAGIVALMLEANPALTWREVKQILEQTATNVSDLADWEGGAGYANAHAAVAKAAALRPGSPIEAGFGDANKLSHAFNSTADIVTGSIQNFAVTFAPYNTPVTSNEASFTVDSDVTLVTARTVVSESALFVVLQAPNGARFSSGVSLPQLGEFIATSAPGMAGTWKVMVRGVCGLNVEPVNPNACAPLTTAGAPPNGFSVPSTVNVTVKTLIARGYTGLSDIGGHAARSFIQVAVGGHLVDGLADGSYQPNAPLTRLQLAQYLAFGGGVRQSWPLDGDLQFSDLAGSEHLYAESATALGAFLRDPSFDARPALEGLSGTFDPTAGVSRTQAAYSLVQSLGLQSVAEAHTGAVQYLHNGQLIPVSDLAGVSASMLGYVQAALDLRLITPAVTLSQGPFELVPTLKAQFKPAQGVTRAEFAVAAVRARDAYGARVDD